MKDIYINSYTAWESLPWAKIEERIYILQDKMHSLSKQYKRKSVKIIQNHIVNSSDVKLFAINKILKNISYYYAKRNKEKYYFNSLDKLFLYNSLLVNASKSRKDLPVVGKIKQYIIYLCLMPEWQAKFEPRYRLDFHFGEWGFQYRISCFFNKRAKSKLKKKVYVSLATKL